MPEKHTPQRSSGMMTAAGPILLALVLAAASGCGLFPDEDSASAPPLPEPPRISQAVTYPVERKDLYEQIEGSARVVPVRQMSLYFTVSGRVQIVYASPDQMVSRGDVLAKLEIDSLEHQRALAVLDRDIAAASLEKMQITNAPVVDRRIQELVVRKHDLNVEYLQDRVDAATIRAPFDGVIKRVQIKPSDQVREYDPVIEISDPGFLELQMNVSESEYNIIEKEMPAEIQVAPETWVPVDIVQTTFLDPSRDASVRREEFIVHLDAGDGLDLRLNARFPARVIITEREGTLVIPASGLREFNNRTYVRVLEGEVRREVDVKVGIRTDTEVEILDGLEEGQLVIGK